MVYSKFAAAQMWLATGLSTGRVLSWMLDTVIQSTLLLALAFFAVRMMRRASGAQRTTMPCRALPAS